MSRNIEVKARIADIEEIEEAASSIADRGPEVIFQDDTFFNCPNGRLKLRVFSTNEGELLFYQRPDIHGLKESTYFITPVMNPDSMREVLTRAYGQVGRVRKTRTLYMVGRTRIHLDNVEGLGNFLELEVVLEEKEEAETGRIIADDLLKQLGITPDRLVDVAYIDLMH